MTNFSNTALFHLVHWLENDKKIALRIMLLIEEIKRNPFTGIGKPEPLKGDFKGFWSKRIDEENRIIYKIEQGVLFIHSCRFHY